MSAQGEPSPFEVKNLKTPHPCRLRFSAASCFRGCGKDEAPGQSKTYDLLWFGML